MSNSSGQSEVKYQTLTPVPPLPSIVPNGSVYGIPPSNNQINHGLYGFSGGGPPLIHPHPVYMQHVPVSHGYQPYPSGEPFTKQIKLAPGINSSADSSSGHQSSSFQVPPSGVQSGLPGLGQQIQMTLHHPGQTHLPQHVVSHHIHTSHHHSAQSHVSPHQLQVHVQHHQQQPPPSQQQQQQQHNQSANHASQGNGSASHDQWPDHHSNSQGSSGLSPGNDSNGGDGKSKKKRKRCGECPGCIKKDNCGECGPCKSVRSHQICKMRKCDQLKTKKEKAREVRFFFHCPSFYPCFNSSNSSSSSHHSFLRFCVIQLFLMRIHKRQSMERNCFLKN